MSIIQGNAHTSAGGGGFQIERSLRFNSADSAYLNRTPASAGNRKTWTWSAWFKRGALSTNQTLFSCIFAANNNSTFHISIETDNLLKVGLSTLYVVTTSQVFRDPSAWYHIVFAFDSTQATSTNRWKLYINGSLVTAFSAAVYPNQNDDWAINAAQSHDIGRLSGYSYNYNGYLTEVNFIDGQALTPSSFGETDSATGVWKPKAFSGTYGTNGFYLKFADNSGTTSTTLGKDSSGNGNNWTPNNFSVTAGAGNDSLVDTPTSYGTDTGVGGSVRGNYVTWNALDRNSSGTLANGNLDWTSGTTAHYGVRGTMSPPSGKWYFEVTAAAATSGTIAYGIGMANAANPLNVGAQSNTGAYLLYGVGTSLELEAAGVQGSTITGASIAANDVIQVAYDVDGSKMWVGKNNTWYNSSGGTTGNPATGANPSFSSLLANLFPFVEVYNNTVYANFGQRAFSYTAPSGFKALCTQNLPTPTIGATSTTQANDYFNVVLYTGAGSGQSITGVGFAPDFIWQKERSSNTAGGSFHYLSDKVRGVNAILQSNTTGAESTGTDVGINTFDSDGFTMGTYGGGNANQSGESYVAWNWKANGAGSTNTAGTITSTVSANTTSGFSIVTYTGNGSAGATVGHGLGVTPGMIIVKSRSVGTGDWVVWHSSLTSSNNNYLILNSTAAVNTANQPWNNTLPTSSVFSLRTWDSVNQNASTYVAYCFAAVAGYSAFGSYTGNFNADGPFVFTGMRPRYIIIKRTDAAAVWFLFDTARNPSNNSANYLTAESSNAEGADAVFDILSNGFKLRVAANSYNANGGTYIYMAFAESPFKYSLAR